MSKIAFIFPGQGSQSMGMGADLIATNEKSKAFYTRADEAVGTNLSDIMLNGPMETLTFTYNAQPALLTTGVMIAERLRDAGITPHYTAGHSLGEFSAFVTSGVMSFEDAVQTVYQRGLLMNEAVPAGEGAMAAVLGMDAEPLATVCEQIASEGEVVQIANYNCPGQIVISGTKQGVELASAVAKQQGAKRVLPLPVSGPFHCKLMAPAAQKLAAHVETLALQSPHTPVISNVSSRFLQDVEEIKAEILTQIVSPVCWQQNIETLIANGVTTFIECGPGKVLSGLVKKVDRSVQTYCVYDEASLQVVIEAAKEWNVCH